MDDKRVDDDYDKMMRYCDSASASSGGGGGGDYGGVDCWLLCVCVWVSI